MDVDDQRRWRHHRRRWTGRYVYRSVTGHQLHHHRDWYERKWHRLGPVGRGHSSCDDHHLVDYDHDNADHHVVDYDDDHVVDYDDCGTDNYDDCGTDNYDDCGADYDNNHDEYDYNDEYDYHVDYDDDCGADNNNHHDHCSTAARAIALRG